jgi:hypothetical protein
MALSTIALNEACDAVGVDTIKLHSGDPTSSGTENEIADTSTAVSLGAASVGIRIMGSGVDINVPPGTVSHYSLWQGTVLKAKDAFPIAEVYAAAGVAKINSATLTISNMV